MRLLVPLLALVAALLAAAPAAAACPTRVVRDAEPDDLVVRTSVATCAPGGGVRLVRRSVLVEDSNGARGRVVLAAARGAGRIATVEATVRRNRRDATTRVVVTSARSGRVLRSTRVGRLDDARFDPAAGVAVAARGQIVAATNRAVLLVTARGAARRLGTTDDQFDVDGRFVVWSTPDGFRTHELRPGRTCRTAGRFVHASTPALVVTSRTYGGFTDEFRGTYTGSAAVWACRPGTGREVVVTTASVSDVPVHVAAQGTTVAVHGALRPDGSTYGLLVTDVLEPSRRRRHVVRCAPGLQSPVAPALHLTTTGVVAMQTHQTRLTAPSAYEEVRTITAVGPDGACRELDRGDVGGLRADGAALSWTNGGQARTATP